ncbi:hypothetical protein GF343_01235 [Candidatus Woesearchaeota archaeon]|nr:hypothetical protein [Candidatus Woesearchaeota archaeon]
MKYAIFIYALFVISLVALIAVIQPIPTGLIVQEELTLKDKVMTPCYCASGENIEQQISEQQKAYESILNSAEQAVERGEISERTAARVLNNYAKESCDKCLTES